MASPNQEKPIVATFSLDFTFPMLYLSFVSLGATLVCYAYMLYTIFFLSNSSLLLYFAFSSALSYFLIEKDT